MQKLFQVMLLFCGITLAFGQQIFTVKGKILDADNGKPVPTASVNLGAYHEESDAMGNFNLKVPAGSYMLLVKSATFNDFQEKIRVDQSLSLTIKLGHDAQQIEGVTFTVKHQQPSTMVVKTLDEDYIHKNAAQNLGNLLTHISGVSALKTGNNIAKPIIHGMYGSRIAILNNGVKMEEQEWGVEHAPNIDPMNYQHIDVVKGASTLKFGSDAIGGAIVLEPPVFPRKDTLMGRVVLSGQTNGRGGGTHVNLAKVWKNGWVVTTNGSMKKLGDLHAPNYGLMNTGLLNTSFKFGLQKKNVHGGFSVDYYLTHQEIGILRASHIGNLQDFYEALHQEEPIYQRPFSYKVENPKQEVVHHLVKLKAFKDFKNFGKLSATYSFQFNRRKEFDIRRGELNQIPSLYLELITNQLNLNHHLKKRNWDWETGIDLSYQNNYNDPQTKARLLIPNYDQYSAGIYSIFKYTFSPRWMVEGAARYEFKRYQAHKWYDISDWEKRFARQFSRFEVRTHANRILTHPKLDYHNISVNLGATYQASKNLRFTFNAARVSRTPNAAELFADGLHHSASVIEIGNLGLKSETGNQLNLVVEAQADILKGLKVSFNPYFFYTENYIDEVPTGIQNTIRGVFPVWMYQQIDAKMFGADLDVEWKLSDNLSYIGRASYVYGQDLTHDKPLIMMVPTNFHNALKYENSRWLNFYFTVENKWFLHQNRFPYQPVFITLYNAEGEAYQAEVDLSTPPKAYNLWDMSLGFDVTKKLSIGLRVNNVLNTEYKDYLNRLRFFSYEMGRNFMLNVKLEF